MSYPRVRRDGLYRGKTEARTMEDERITLRMGSDDVQMMDAYIEDHPELGPRSRFIRTAVSAYINRDADVRAPSGGTGVFVGLTETQMGALAALRKTGRSYGDAEYIRGVLQRHFETEENYLNAARDAYQVSFVEGLRR